MVEHLTIKQLFVSATGAVLFLGCMSSCTLQARDLGQWDAADPAIAHWYRSLRQPDNPVMSCCGEADAYWADASETVDGKFYAIITDDRPDEPLKRKHIPPGTRFEVPAAKFNHQGGNPTGHAIIFISAYQDVVLCYAAGSLI